MSKTLFLLPLIFFTTAYANLFDCPNGCGTDTDPDLAAMGDTLVSGLKKMGLLDPECSSGAYLRGRQRGAEWELEWNVTVNEDVEERDDFDEDDEDYEPPNYGIDYFYEFETRKSDPDDDFQESVGLENFASTKKVLSLMEEDAEFVYAQQKRETEEAIAWLKQSGAEKKAIDAELQHLSKDEKEKQRRQEIVRKTESEVNAVYEQIFSWCIAHHKWKGSIYSRGLLFFEKGEFSDAFDDVSGFIAQVKQHERDKFLQADVYFNQGKSASEIGMYNEAIKALSEAIDKNPRYRDAYFERAVAYFETGNFDRAFSDYLASNLKPQSFLEQTEDFLLLTSAMMMGLQQGSAIASIEYFPSLLSAVFGINQALWAFAQDPVQVSKDFVDAAFACANYVRENSSREILEMVVPELKELTLHWDELDAPKRANQISYIIGKYGIEIFASAGTTKAVKVFQDLKRANNLLTFEAMALSKRNKAHIAAEAVKRAEARKRILKSSNLKIQMDKQGKHIVGHKNYVAMDNKSIFEHSDPQRLVNDFAGTGRKATNIAPGMPGYIELVNFNEFIGYSIDKTTGQKIGTTWGKIHYAKDGVHVVPTAPRG